MPLDLPNDCRSSFSCRREKRSVTSPSVQDFIAGLRDEKSVNMTREMPPWESLWSNLPMNLPTS